MLKENNMITSMLEQHTQYYHHRIKYQEDPIAKKAREHFNKLIKNNMAACAELITSHEVRKLLDPFPYDVVSSDVFLLQEISIGPLYTVGTRHVSCSRSVGPIVVDMSDPLAREGFGKSGVPLVIEGKHRVLDARSRNEFKIIAWVGDKVLPILQGTDISGWTGPR